jgi:hypothetical protein
VNIQVAESSVVVATTATFVPPAKTLNIKVLSPKAVVRASVIPAEPYRLSKTNESIVSRIRPGSPSDVKEKPRQFLRRNATAERVWNCFKHSFTDHFLEQSPSVLIAPV